MRPMLAVFAAVLAFPFAASAQETVCVPGNPLYDHGDYRCFNHPPRPTRARATVRVTVEAARHLSGASLTPTQREQIEDHLTALRDELAASLPSLTDDRGAIHTPDVRLAVVLLPSGSVGRVRVLTRHGDPLDRQVAQSLAAAVSEHGGMDLDGSEVEAVVRLRPQLRYTRWRPRVVHVPCCVDSYEED